MCNRSSGGRGSVKQRVLRDRHEFEIFGKNQIHTKRQTVPNPPNLKPCSGRTNQTSITQREGRELRSNYSNCSDEQEIEVVYDRNWFTTKEIDTFAKLHKNPFVLLQKLASTGNITLASDDNSSEVMLRKGRKLRRSFIHLEKLSMENYNNLQSKIVIN